MDMDITIGVQVVYLCSLQCVGMLLVVILVTDAVVVVALGKI